MTKLAILIPVTPDRQLLYNRLKQELDIQRRISDDKNEVNIITLLTPPYDKETNKYSTGSKRNELIQKALEDKAEYISFFDSDDFPGITYIKRGLEVANSGMDCGELWGQYYSNGIKGNPFHHSIEYDHWFQDDKTYFRNPNHLNFLRLEAIRDIKYPDITIGEDGQYSLRLQHADVLKTQYPIPEIIYHYYSGYPKHEIK